MIRANLMPVEARGTTVFGYRLEIEDLWRALAAIVVALLFAVPTWFIFELFVHNDQSQLDAVNDRLAQLATQTNDVGALSSNTKRLQDIDREAVWLKSSGQLIAIRLASLGNVVPNGVWLEHIAQDRNGWTFEGSGTSLPAMGTLLSGVSRLSPGLQTSFRSIDDASTGGNVYGFKAAITQPSPTPAPTPTPGSSQ